MYFLLSLLFIACLGVMLAAKAEEWGWERLSLTGWIIAATCFGIGSLAIFSTLAESLYMGKPVPPVVIVGATIIIVGFWRLRVAMRRIRNERLSRQQ
jgi:hypothetical protein